MMALGTMYELYPDMPVDDAEDPSDSLKVTPSDITVGVGETETLKPNKEGCTFETADDSIAKVDENGTVTGVSAGETTIKVSKDGETVEVTVTVTATTTSTTETSDTTESSTTETETTASSSVTSGSVTPGDVLLGDTNLDGRVDITDAVILNKAVAGAISLNSQQQANADCCTDDGVGANDAIVLLKFLVSLVKTLPSAD